MTGEQDPHFGPYYSEAGGAFPGEVGPIYVEGATTKDLLKVRIVKVRPNHRYATEMPKSRVKRMEIDLQPMLGRVAVAPRGEEAFAGLWPGDFGGNMDAQEVVAGTGLETSMDVVLEIDVVKGRPSTGPGWRTPSTSWSWEAAAPSSTPSASPTWRSVVAKIRKRYLAPR